MKLTNAKAIVTGGASGLGLAVARKLTLAGGSVTILDLQAPPAGAFDVAGAQAPHLIVGDVTSEPSVERAVREAAEAMGGITLAVNCAGIAQSQRVIGRHRLLGQAEFSHVIHTNLVGTFNVCRSTANLMQGMPAEETGERGVIINTASIAAFDGQVGQAAYAASKGGVVSMTLPLAREFARFGVRVVAIAPGLFDTPLLEELPRSAREQITQAIPFPARLGNPKEFAELVCHIYTNSMLNGEVIRLDAALRM